MEFFDRKQGKYRGTDEYAISQFDGQVSWSLALQEHFYIEQDIELQFEYQV